MSWLMIQMPSLSLLVKVPREVRTGKGPRSPPGTWKLFPLGTSLTHKKGKWDAEDIGVQNQEGRVLRQTRRRRLVSTNTVWEKATRNKWWKWAEYTGQKNSEGKDCVVCASERPNTQVIDVPWGSEDCRTMRQIWKKKNCRPHTTYTQTYKVGNRTLTYETVNCSGSACIDLCKGKPPMCHYHCVLLAGVKKGIYNIAHNCPNWPRTAMDAAPKEWRVQPDLRIQDCYWRESSTGSSLGHYTGECERIWNITDALSLIIPVKGGSPPPPYVLDYQVNQLADLWWLCGPEKGLLAHLPLNWRGLCARVILAQSTVILPVEKEIKPRKVKRAYTPDPRVQLDAIGQPRGIPNEFKARNEIAAGFESIFVWITPSKNTEWINYIYYNQQRFINYSDDALEALGEQLDATSKMAWQNRQALDWLLAEKGGVCVMFGDQCCTFIPNNTDPEGSFTQAMNKLKNLRTEVKENAGFGHEAWSWLDRMLGRWGAWFAKAGAVAITIITVLGFIFCCFLPALRSFLTRVAARQMMVTSSSRSRGKTEERENLELPPMSVFTMTLVEIETHHSVKGL
ncbi:syncytin-2-like [Scyliorhinus canicula]|uniref:syncytin-2-like n=1 Tax=Scyliorhinus canicula TaxID=7830 RepID=UPI0018F2E23B|nr:syncytin-2-like [Scyliorhinus canicula]